MEDNKSIKPGESIELKFKDFMKKLLDAQSYDFMNEVELFSRNTLKAILNKFCNIIAEEVNCESCTIHLQMYDPKMMDEELLKKYIVEHLLKAYKYYVGDKEKTEKEQDLRTQLIEIVNPDPDHEKTEHLEKLHENFKEFVKIRLGLLTSSLAFPYWAYLKGSASLVAINKGGPWIPIIEGENSHLKYISPYSGVSKVIFQENVAKVRDRLSIRETRDFKKLGSADMIVWNNTCWKYVFKNYYGVPIRIHSAGEVVGILKAENKNTMWKGQQGKPVGISKHIKRILSSNTSKKLIDEMVNIIKSKFNENPKVNSLNVSFLSLVYLEDDLKADECKKNVGTECRFEKLLFIPYPEYEHVNGLLEGVYKRIKQLFKNPNEIENPKAFLEKENSRQDPKWQELFRKKGSLCKIFRNFIEDFCYYEPEIKQMESQFQTIEGLKQYLTDHKIFKKEVRKILKQVDAKIKKIKNRSINSLKPVGEDSSPPMQLFTKSIDDERRLWKLLVNVEDVEDKAGDCADIYKQIKKLYKIVKNKVYQKIDYKEPKLDLTGEEKKDFEVSVKDIIVPDAVVEASIDNWKTKTLKLPDFHFKISLTFNPPKKREYPPNSLKQPPKQPLKQPQAINIYMVVLPTREEIKKGNILNDKKEYYKRINNLWLEEFKNGEDTPDTLENYWKHRQKLLDQADIQVEGEFIIFPGSVRVTDFILDRLAARIQAFAHALPLEEFSFEDTYKLTWAAYEIGKLIEREISYRANRHVDPMPLTAMEFYRMPISDLSFVDDLRSRRTILKKIDDNINVYLKNIIIDMDITDDVEFSSRIKEYRSMFRRSGERFEGYIRGNIALWVFLLSLIIDDNTILERKDVKEDNKNNDENELIEFYKNLEKFRTSILGSMKKKDAEFFENYRMKGALKHLYGDLKFDSPSFLDAKNLLDLYDTKNLLNPNNQTKNTTESQKPDDKEKIKTSEIEKIVTNLQEIIQYQFNKFKLKDEIQIYSIKQKATFDLELLTKSINKTIQCLKEFKKKEVTEIILSNYKEFKGILEYIKISLDSIFKKEKNDYKRKLTEAFNLIRGNLEKEGFEKDSFWNIDTDTDIENYFKVNQGLLTDLLLRNYSYFIRDSLSLLIQIANLLKILQKDNMDELKEYRNFYKKCRELREFLCSSPQQKEGKEKYHLEKIFTIGNSTDNDTSGWPKIKEFINKNNTNSVFDNGEEDYLSLNRKSIYKRIRMLNHILHRQIPLPMLDWELGRFDLYGTRMNCLFKNQVFVLLEKIWNKGDPFFLYVPEAEALKDYYYHDKSRPIITDKYRQRWICLRAKYLEGEYNASQVTALIDPKTAEPGYWEKINTYNMKSVQYVLGKIFNEFEVVSAWKYRNYSWHRHLISKCHHKWYKYKISLLKKEKPHENNVPKKTRWFGSFLFSGVINLLLLLLGSTIDQENKLGNRNRYGFHIDTLKIIDDKMKQKLNKSVFYSIIQNLYYGIERGLKYSDEIKKAFMGDKLLSQISFLCSCKDTGKSLGGDEENNCDKLLVCRHTQKKDGKCLLYDRAEKFVEEIIKEIEEVITKNPQDKHQLDFDRDIFEKIITHLQDEMKFFIELRKKDSIEESHQIPLFFIDKNQRDRFGHETLHVFEGILKGLEERLKNKENIKEIKVNYWAFIYRTLERIRREQNSYLFDMGDKDNDHGGLWMRDKEETLERIKNYVLLYSEKFVDESNKRHFFGWNAHDLYYYIHSLIPMEIQIRTELTDTFAVQYHDSIYKVQPSPGTEFPHTMIKNTGESLEKLDRELEVDYEDYILKYRPNRKKKGL